MTSQIQFGTSGHRGLMGTGFTLDHVRAVGAAVASYLKQTNLSAKLIIGYDPRAGNDPFLGRMSFTGALVDILEKEDIEVWFCDTFMPTPVISWAITHYDLDGGLILTASHNPPAYNGIKFNPKNGAPAPESVTRLIEKNANAYLSLFPSLPPHTQPFMKINPVPEFAKQLEGFLQTFFRGATCKGMAIVVDAKHGAVGPTWTALASRLGAKLTLIHGQPRPDFGNETPNPTDHVGLKDLQDQLKQGSFQMGIANDPDGDRHLLLDETGSPLSPEETLVILATFFHQRQLPLHTLCATLASSSLVSRCAKKLGIEYVETAVGFKYFAPYFEQAKAEGKTAFAVESSGGFSASFHTLEKCGFLPAVLMLGILASTQKLLSRLRLEAKREYGTLTFLEEGMPANDTLKQTIQNWKTTPPYLSFPQPLAETRAEDGLKWTFLSGDWVLLRPSGTEPLIRIYVESEDDARANSILQWIKSVLHLG